MGTVDKSIRLIAAIIMVVLYYTGIVNGGIALVLLILAVIFALTSLINFCPLYKLIGVNTCKVKE